MKTTPGGDLSPQGRLSRVSTQKYSALVFLAPGSSGLPPSGGPVLLLVHRGPLVHRDDTFRSGRVVAQSAMRPVVVVLDTPLLDQDFGLTQAVKQFTAQEFLAKAGVEAFAVSVFPR